MSDPLASAGLANFLTTLPPVADRPDELNRQSTESVSASRRAVLEQEQSRNGLEIARNDETGEERDSQSSFVSRPLNTVVLQPDVQEDPAAAANLRQTQSDVLPQQAVNTDAVVSDETVAPQTVGAAAFSEFAPPEQQVAQARAQDPSVELREPAPDGPGVRGPEANFPVDIEAAVEEDGDFDPETEVPAPRSIPGGPFENIDPQPVAVDPSDDSGERVVGLSGNDPVAEAAADPSIVEEEDIIEAGVFQPLQNGETALSGQPAVLVETPSTLEEARLGQALRGAAQAGDSATLAQAGLTAETPDGAVAEVPEELSGLAASFGLTGNDPVALAARIGSPDPDEIFNTGADAIAAPVTPQDSAAIAAAANVDPEEAFGTTGNDPLTETGQPNVIPQAATLQADDDEEAFVADRDVSAAQNQNTDQLIRPTLEGVTTPLSEVRAEAIGVDDPAQAAGEFAVDPAGGGLTAATNLPFGDPIEQFAPFPEPADAGATLNEGDAIDREQLFTPPNGGVPRVSGQDEFEAARAVLADDPDPIELFNDADGVGRIAATTSGSRLTNEGVAENSENVVTAADPEEIVTGFLIDETEFNREVDLEQVPIDPADLQQIRALGLDPEENFLIGDEEVAVPAPVAGPVESAQPDPARGQNIQNDPDPDEFFIDEFRPESITEFDPDPTEFAEAVLLNAPLAAAANEETPGRAESALDPAAGGVSEGFVNTQIEPDTAEAIDPIDAAISGDVPQSTQTPDAPGLADFDGQDVRQPDPIVRELPGGIVDVNTQLRNAAQAVNLADDAVSAVSGTVSAGNPIAVDIGPDAEIRVLGDVSTDRQPPFEGPPQPVSGGEPSAFAQVSETLRATTFTGVQSAGTVDSFV